MVVIGAGIYKLLVRIANGEDPDQPAFQKPSDLCLSLLSMPGRQLVFKILVHLSNPTYSHLLDTCTCRYAGVCN